MSADQRKVSLKHQLSRLVEDIAGYGVANLKNYRGISDGYVHEHGQEWLKDLYKRSGTQTKEQQIWNGISASVVRGGNMKREGLAVAGYALDKGKVGPCTAFAAATANRILTAQENKLLPKALSVRIVSGIHKEQSEAHVCVIIDVLPIDGIEDEESFLNSTQTTSTSIILDTWYGAQGGKYVFSPDEFASIVGDYLQLGEATEKHYSVSKRDDDMLESDILQRIKGVNQAENNFKSINVIDEETKIDDIEYFKKSVKFLEHVLDLDLEKIEDFDAIEKEKLASLKKLLGLDDQDIIKGFKFDLINKSIELTIKYYDFSKDSILNAAKIFEKIKLEDEDKQINIIKRKNIYDNQQTLNTKIIALADEIKEVNSEVHTMDESQLPLFTSFVDKLKKSTEEVNKLRAESGKSASQASDVKSYGKQLSLLKNILCTEAVKANDVDNLRYLLKSITFKQKELNNISSANQNEISLNGLAVLYCHGYDLFYPLKAEYNSSSR